MATADMEASGPAAPDTTDWGSVRARVMALAGAPITVEVGPFMPLVIEAVGTGPRGGTLIGVRHQREQEGDLLFDPEVVFERVGETWHPMTYEQSGVIYTRAVFLDDETGRLMCRPFALAGLRNFCKLWDANLRDQGFVAAA